MARIRFIKPEFWQNEQLAAVSEHARLLAIALLNHADDEGYFLANVSLIRSACFPFEDDSTKIRGSINELSQIGYIEVRHGSGKDIGRVCTFTRHQKIDKKRPSKLKQAFNAETPEITPPQERSESLPRTFPEHSEKTTRLEQGTGNREQGTGNREREREQGETANAETLTAPTPASAPAPDPAWADDWARWIASWESRTSKRFDPITAEVQLMQLHGLSPAKAAADLRFSLQKSAKSILDSDDRYGGNQYASKRQAKRRELAF